MGGGNIFQDYFHLLLTFKIRFIHPTGIYFFSPHKTVVEIHICFIGIEIAVKNVSLAQHTRILLLCKFRYQLVFQLQNKRLKRWFIDQIHDTVRIIFYVVYFAFRPFPKAVTPELIAAGLSSVGQYLTLCCTSIAVKIAVSGFPEGQRSVL